MGRIDNVVALWEPMGTLYGGSLLPEYGQLQEVEPTPCIGLGLEVIDKVVDTISIQWCAHGGKGSLGGK